MQQRQTQSHNANRSLSGAFGDLNFSLSREAAQIREALETQATEEEALESGGGGVVAGLRQLSSGTWRKLKTPLSKLSLRGRRSGAVTVTTGFDSLPGGFPNWCTVRVKPNQEAKPLHFKLTMTPRVFEYSHGVPFNNHIINDFEEARKAIAHIRAAVAQMSSADEEVRLNTLVMEDMMTVVFGSNSIERVGLGLDETIRLCKEIMGGQHSVFKKFPPRSPEYAQALEAFIRKDATNALAIRERREVLQHAAAFVHITNAIVKRDEPFSERLLMETHKILTNGIVAHGSIRSKDWAGKYRKIAVGVGDVKFPAANDVPQAMKSFLNTFNSNLAQAELNKTIDPFYIAAKACGDFVNIHPFADGNGRMCRLILNAVLLRYAGCVVPIGEHDHERQEYIAITKRRSEGSGAGELTVYTLRKSAERLKKLSGQMYSHVSTS